MRKAFASAEEDNWRDTASDSCSLGNLDLLNLSIPPDFFSDRRIKRPFYGAGDYCTQNSNPLEPQSSSTSKHRNHPLQRSTRTLVPNLQNLPQGYGISCYSRPTSPDIRCNFYKQEKKAQVLTGPVSERDSFLTSSKKTFKKTADVLSDDRSYLKEKTEEGTFPFKLTPSGNFKVNSQQVIYSSKKLSVIVADPKETKVRIEPEVEKIEMAQDSGDMTNQSVVNNIINQVKNNGGLSSLGSLIATTPIRSAYKESSEYESKDTSEILEPELNLGRLGYNGMDAIVWDKVSLPEKKNLYLELYTRITNYTNADCKVYIDNEEFNCHLIVLQCYSELFDAYVAVKKVELPSDKVSAVAFAFIYEWMITGEPSYKDLTRDNVLDIFCSAKYLKIKDLVEQCWSFIDHPHVFSEDTAFLLFLDAKSRDLPEVRELMIPRIQTFFLMLVSSQDWLELDVDDVKTFLRSNYISVNCEMEIFMSAVRWLKYDWHHRDIYKYEILECIRFGNIAPWQLVDIKRNPENPDFMELAKDPRICKMIDDGLAYVIIKYWYGQENDDFQHWNSVLGLTEPPVRNWTGNDRTFYTYREYLIFLDQFRREQMILRNGGFKNDNPDRKLPIDFMTDERLSPRRVPPRMPTQEDFLGRGRRVSKVKSRSDCRSHR